jgi:hypothetical protein
MDALRSYAIFDPQTPILRGNQSDPRPRHPMGLGGGQLAEAVSSLIGSSLGTRLTQELTALVEWTGDASASRASWEIISPSIPTTADVVHFKDRFLRSDLQQLSAHDASEGTLYVLFALVMVLHPSSPRFFAIENFGHALHPRLARALIGRLGELAIERRRQIIMTTHNPLALDGLAIADDRIRLFTIDRTASGHTKIERITHSEALGRALESGLTVSQMWNQGLLGGVPPL